MELWVARQPIFDVHTNVVAYELLYRSGPVNAFDGSEGNSATARVISAGFYSPAGREILARKPAFINFPRELLAGGGAAILPPEEAVIEILETVAPDLQVMLACHDLRARGYRLALDDFVPTAEPNPLTGIADYIKVDFRETSAQQQIEAVHSFHATACLVAEKVETQEEFERAKAMGYALFQGYFFARPVIVSTTEMTGARLHRLRLLQQLQHPEMDFTALSALIQQDSGLSYKLLRFVNSALFSIRKPIESLERACVFIGELAMRRWLTILLLTDMTSDRPAELAVNALLRARFCELLAAEAGLSVRAADLFLLGLFSHLDAMYGRPLDELMRGLNLRDDITETLLDPAAAGHALGHVWNTVLAYEQADWDRMTHFARKSGIGTAAVQPLYAAAARWSDRVIHGQPQEDSDAPSATALNNAMA